MRAFIKIQAIFAYFGLTLFVSPCFAQEETTIQITQALWSGRDVTQIMTDLCVDANPCIYKISEAVFGIAEQLNNKSFHVQWKCSGSDTIHYNSEPHDATDKVTSIECGKQRNISRRKIELPIRTETADRNPTPDASQPKIQDASAVADKPKSKAPPVAIQFNSSDFPASNQRTWKADRYSRSLRAVALSTSGLAGIAKGCNAAIASILNHPSAKLSSSIIRNYTAPITQRVNTAGRGLTLTFCSSTPKDVLYANGNHVLDLFDDRRQDGLFWNDRGFLELADNARCFANGKKFRATLRADAVMLNERKILNPFDRKSTFFKKLYLEQVRKYPEFAACKEEFYGTWSEPHFMVSNRIYHLILEESGVDVVDYLYGTNDGEYLRVLNPYSIHSVGK